MSKLALCMISNEPEQVVRILTNYSQYFDRVYITIADKHPEKVGFSSPGEGIKVSHFKWCDHFGKARNYNWEQIEDDITHVFWMDSDDELDHPERLSDIVKYMEQTDTDVVYLKYDYAQNDLNESIADHWRERVVRKDAGLVWADSRAHETLIPKSGQATQAKLDWVTVVHQKKPEDNLKSIERNTKLLEQDYEETHDPRVAHYLGLTYMAAGDYQKAVAYFVEHIKHSGWDEESYRSYLKIAECFYLQSKYDLAIEATNKALDLLPNYPDAYYLKAMIYSDMEEYEKCYEWIQVALAKPQPETLSIVDPTLYTYRGMFLGALAALQIGEVKAGWELYQTVIKNAPDYPVAKELQELFEEAHYDDVASEKVRWLYYYLAGNNGDPVKLFQSLPYRLFQDPRLNVERTKAIPPQKWPEKSIAYFCGQSGESWGPDTLDKGMGGSEEAVVYLTRELAKQGWQVTVFNDREEEYYDSLYQDCWRDGSYIVDQIDAKVTYKPWTVMNPDDEFDVLVVWRAPEYARGFKARKILVDLHDTVEAERVYKAAKDPKVTFMVKSAWHRSLYPDLPDERFVVVGNGILKEHFND